MSLSRYSTFVQVWGNATPRKDCYMVCPTNPNGAIPVQRCHAKAKLINELSISKLSEILDTLSLSINICVYWAWRSRVRCCVVSLGYIEG